MNVTQDSPTQAWVEDWVAFLTEMLPLIFLVVVLISATFLIAKTGGGLGKAVSFGAGAALVFLLVTNLEEVSNFIGEELPIEGLSVEPDEANGSEGADGADDSAEDAADPDATTDSDGTG